MKRIFLFAFALGLLYVSIGNAQQYPVADAIANKIIAKYQSSTCEQLWVSKSQKKPPTQEEQNAIQMLKANPQMRQEFIGKIASPIANKMFDCGMVP
jgi:hypothetical protein